MYTSMHAVLVTMDNWPVNFRVFAVTTYIETKSVTITQRRFRRMFNVARHGRIPSRNAILLWVRMFNRTGSVRSVFAGRPSVRNEENIERVRIAVQRSPTRSAVRHAAALQLSDRTFRRILHKNLRFHPYKIQMAQQLKQQDNISRLHFANEFIAILNENGNVLNNLFMSDEAHFYLNGYVNKQNYRYWADRNPMQLHERPLHSEKVTVWCAVSAQMIIGPYFFEDDNGRAVTVNGERYREMLQQFFIPELRRSGININDTWFQQDGATAHTARETLNLLRNVFHNHLISRFGDIPWPPRSPDVTAPDYFLWGKLKEKVFRSRPHTIQELKNRISQEIEEINRDQNLLQRVMDNFRKRLEELAVRRGSHLFDVIFKK